jgi:hypothetical protein
MNKLIDFAKENRTTCFFKDLAIAEINVAYRCMEYLAPDENFKPKDLIKKTQLLVDNQLFEEASSEIIDNEVNIGIDSSHYMEVLREQTIELLNYLYPIRQKQLEQSKELKRQQLLKQLAELGQK